MVNLNGGTLTYSFLPYVMHSTDSILYDSLMEPNQPHLLNIVLLLLLKIVAYNDLKQEALFKLYMCESHSHVSKISFHYDVSWCMFCH